MQVGRAAVKSARAVKAPHGERKRTVGGPFGRREASAGERPLPRAEVSTPRWEADETDLAGEGVGAGALEISYVSG
jgi:hypothetical protein